MNTILRISYNTSRNSRAASSYTLSMAETDQPITSRLVQQGATFNNLVRYTGVFATQRQAVVAALDYIDAVAVRLVEINRAGEVSVVLQNAHRPAPKADEFTLSARVLGSKNARGVFVAS